MAAAMNPASGNAARRSRTIAMIFLVLNVVGPLIFGGLMILGTMKVIEKQKLLDAKTREVETANATLERARADVAKAKALSDELKGTNDRLLAQKESLKQNIAELGRALDDSDPDKVVARVRRQLTASTPLLRADAFYKAGRDAYAQGNKALAARLYEESLQEYERYAPTLIGLGRLQADQGNFYQAEALYRRAADADPKNANAIFNIAFVNMLLKRYDKAEEYAAKALLVDPEYSRVNELRAEIARRRTADARR